MRRKKENFLLVTRKHSHATTLSKKICLLPRSIYVPLKLHLRKQTDVKQMKFFNFTELGSCCRSQDEPEESESHESGGHVSTSKRGRRCAAESTKTDSAVHRRPALPAISEDGVVAQVVEDKSKQTVQKKFQAKGGSMAKNHRYSSPDSSTESRKNSAPTVIIPTFSPTPFVF